MKDKGNAPISEDIRQRLMPEFDKTADKWADLRLRAIYRYHNLKIGNSEREFNLSLSLLSISVAFLAIVVPLLKDYSSDLFFFDLGCFFACSILGLIDLFWTIYRDRHFLEMDSLWEDGNYKMAQATALDVREKLIKGTAVSGDVNTYLSLKAKFSDENEKRTKDRDKAFWTNFLKYLHRIFIGLFFIGLVLLVIVTALKLLSPQSSVQNNVPIQVQK